MNFSGSFLADYALALMYIIVAGMAGYRLFRIQKYRGAWDVTKSFAVFVFLHNVVRSVAFSLMCLFSRPEDKPLNSDDPYLNVLFVLLLIPDVVFVSTYSLLILQFLRSFFACHVNFSVASYRYTALGARQPSGNLLYMLFNGGLYVASVVITIFFLSKGIDESTVLLFLAAMNWTLVAVVLGAGITQFVRYAGSPYKSAACEEKFRKLTGITIFWTIGRIIRAVYDHIQAAANSPKTPDLPAPSGNENDVAYFMVVIALHLVAEVLPCLLVIDWSFMGLLLLGEEDNYLLPTAQRSASVSQRHEWKLAPTDFDKFEEVGSRSHGLGIVHRGQCRGKEVAVKVYRFQKLSKYVLEEVSSEVDTLRALEHEGLVPIQGVCLEAPVLAVVVPLLQGRSLFALLHGPDARLDWPARLRVAKDLARTFVYLHSLSPPRTHGHLTSHNVFVDEKNATLLDDVGLSRLKKYAGVVSGYSNKSGWTAPELLSDSCKTIINAPPAADVYSFGVILWELWAQTVPFRSMPLSQIKSFVVEQESRPSMPANTPPKLAELIRSCWQTAPDARPSFTQIVARLNAL